MGKAATIALVSLAAGVVGGGSVAAEADYTVSRQTASYTLSAHGLGHSTAETFRFDYVNPDDPSSKPLAVSRVVTVLPRGAHYNPSVPESCTASDAELMSLGAAACPPGSAIGGGVVTVDTGLPGPARTVTADVEFFNNATDPAGEFIYLNTVRGTGARTVIRADVTRRRTITEPGMLPGTPPDGGAIDTVDITVDAVRRQVDGKVHRYIRTPPRCPPRGSWPTRVLFTYPDDVTQKVRDRTPCEAAR
jgi:hypothetical protein